MCELINLFAQNGPLIASWLELHGPQLAGVVTDFLSWGVLGVLFTALLAHRRERTSAKRAQRASLASDLLKCVAERSGSRLYPSGTNPNVESQDTALLLAQFRFNAQLGSSNPNLAQLVDECVREVRFGQPAPDTASILGRLTAELLRWSQ
jgi:hypothetical protein